MNRAELQSLADALLTSGELTDACVDDADPNHPRIYGSTQVDGVDVDLRVDFDAPFPAGQPVVYVVDPHPFFANLSHVDASGQVCYLSAEGRIIDWRHPDRLALECVSRAKRVLREGITGENDGDYADEFDAHWGEQNPEVIVSVVDPGDQVCEIVGAEIDERIILARSISDVEAFENRQLKHVTRHTALFLPIADASPFTPLPKLSQLAEVRRAIWESLGANNARRLDRLLRNRTKRSDHVILQLPRPDGDPALVGLRFDGIGGKHPLLDGGSTQTIKPLKTLRCDRTYLMPRAGASNALSERQVCVVGCGAVGSRLVDQLVHAGVGTLMLIDPDDLTPDNTYRHLLGRAWWTKNKAEAVAEWAMGNLPYLRVRPVGEDILSVLEKIPTSDMTDLDLIVFATGNHTVESAANAALSGRTRPPMLFTWLEPLGIGGHALLSPRDEQGCLDCVLTDPSGAFCENRMSFAAPGQTFTRDISGCGSRFTPFSNMDAEATAVLAARLAIDHLSGSVKHATATSWKGDASRFLAAGYELSDRYHSTSLERVTGFESALCPTCGGGRIFGV